LRRLHGVSSEYRWFVVWFVGFEGTGAVDPADGILGYVALIHYALRGGVLRYK
jgi:hypothetical protein